jgi:hypothetical protein
MTCASARFPVKIDERAESMKVAPNDGNHEWKSQGSGPRERLRRAADAEPDRVCRCDPSVGPIGGLKSCQEKVTAEKHIDSTEYL